MKNLLSNKNIYYTFKVQDKIKQFFLIAGNIYKQSLTLQKRQILTIASVLNDEISPEILKHLYRKISGENDFNKIINDLLAGDFFEKNENGFLLFKDKVLKDNIYNNLDKNCKLTLHELSAESIAHITKTNEKVPFEQIIHHYTKSGNNEMLKHYLWKAAADSVSDYDFKGANKFYLRLLVLVDNDDEKFDLVLKIADVYRHAGEWDVELKFVNSYTFIFKEKYKQISLLIRTANIYRIKSDYHKSLRILYRANNLLKSAYNEELDLTIKLEHAKIKLNKGSHKEAYKDFEKLTNTKFEHINNEALKCKGIALAKLGEYEESISIHQQLFEKAEKSRDKIKMTAALIDLGEGYMYLGEYDKANEKFNIAFNLSKRTGSSFEKVGCLGNIGIICLIRRDYFMALKYLSRQINEFKNLSNRAGIARAYGMVGACLINMGKYKKALKYLFYQLNILGKIKRNLSKAICLGNIGVIYNFTGDFEQSTKYFKKQLLIDELYGNKEGIFRTTLNIGIQYYHMKQYNKAEKKLSLAIDKANNINQKISLDIAYGYYCNVLYERMKYEKAIQFADRAIEITKNSNNNLMFIQASILKEKALLKYKDGNLFNTIDNITKYLDFRIEEEEKALIYYEIWKLKANARIDAFYEKELALRLYEKIFLSIPQYEFKEKIKELKNV